MPSAMVARRARADAAASNHQRTTASSTRTVLLARCGGTKERLAARRRQQLLRSGTRCGPTLRSAVWDTLRPELLREKRGFSSSTAEKRCFSVAKYTGSRRSRPAREHGGSYPDDPGVAPRSRPVFQDGPRAARTGGAARRIATAHATTWLGGIRPIHPTHPFLQAKVTAKDPSGMSQNSVAYTLVSPG